MKKSAAALFSCYFSVIDDFSLFFENKKSGASGGRQPHGLGLRNSVGENICYANAALQALSMIPDALQPLRTVVLRLGQVAAVGRQGEITL